MAKRDIYKLQNGSDIRGVACDGVAGESVNLTEKVAFKLGAAFAQWLSIKIKKSPDKLKIGIGRDSRITGPALLNSCVQGLKSLGVQIVDCGLATTPAMFMSCVFDETSFDGSIMITASHLPFNRNGLKFFDHDGGLDHEDITILLEIADEIKDALDPAVTADCEKFDLLSLYAGHLRSSICRELNCTENDKPLSGLKIVVDAGNGCGGFFVEKVLAPLGAQTNGSQFLEPDGNFPNHIPNPENKDAMASIKQTTVRSAADLGLIFDTDVDRMSCVLPDGTEVNRDSIIALVAAILAPDHPGSTIVTDSVTSDRLTYFLETGLKLNHLRFVRGYKNVINKQKELTAQGIDCPLAMETSGHGALKENYFLDDGAFLSVKIIIALAKVKREGKELSSLIDRLPRAVPGEEQEFRFKILEEDFERYGKTVLEDFEQFADEAGYDLPRAYEGVRISFKRESVKGWILLRLSLHDPIMPLNIEGERPGDLEKLKEIARRLLCGFDGLDLSPLEM